MADTSTDGASGGPSGGYAGITSDPRHNADGGMQGGDAESQRGEKPERDPKEEARVRKLWKEWERGRKFDENFRKQVAIDRQYAAGTSDLSWAVTTNLIGAFIDILVALLYARDPDVSVKKSPQVDDSGTEQMEAFALTAQIIISHLWKKGKLKRAARKKVRSILSTGEGWLKVNLLSEKQPQPETEKALNDAQETYRRVKAQIALMEDPDGKSEEELEGEREEKEALIAELEGKLELAVNKMLAIDFVRTERIQVSTDIESIEDYLDAGWIGDESFINEEDALERFPRLHPDELKTATKYYQNQPKELTTRENSNALPQGTMTAESAQTFSPSQSGPEQEGFVHVVEIWDRRDKHIRTLIEGVHAWPKEPFVPPYPTSRFYPYFYTAFYEVDGQRHAQSLSWRLYKLQDEYSATRSNFRLTRERSIPGVFFNATMLDDTEARKIEGSKTQEFTALKLSDPSIPLESAFAAKPVQGIDPRLYDPTYILSDMERISGVQEALSAAINKPGNPSTATEASIQQQGTNARTSSDRDYLEDTLTEIAQYTLEQSLQCITGQEAARIAGVKAFWPHGMSIEDLFTMAEVGIQAGSTGKPKAPADQQVWATLLPLIKETLVEIRQALANGDDSTVQVLTELIKETMKRLGDETDPDRFIPKAPAPGSPGAGTPPPPVMPNISVSLKGELSPEAAAALVSPAVALDQAAMPKVPAAPPEPGSQPAPPATGVPGITPPQGGGPT
jgi:hypothetical protein